MLGPELLEEREHEPAQLVAALRIALVTHFLEEELERRLVVAGLESRQQLRTRARGAKLGDQLLAGRRREELVEERRHRRRRLRANELPHDAAVAKSLDGGDAADAVLVRQGRVRFDVDLHQREAAVPRLDLALEHGSERVARAAPVGPEVDDDRELARALYDIRLEGRGRHVHVLNVAARLGAVRAMVLDEPGRPLRAAELPRPEPGQGRLLVRVHACGVCRTDLHVVDGELRHPKLPLVPGHQIVGVDEATGRRVGIPWLGWTCGYCRYCRSGRENLCDEARFTGYDLDGGYAEYSVADERFCFPIPEGYPDVQAAPLLCAGLIGYRSLRLAGDPERLGLYGFGASAHIVAQVAGHEGRRVFAFTRAGDEKGQAFARSLGAEWAGATTETPPEELDAAIIFAPVGELVPVALGATAKGGVVVCAGIHMSDIPSFPYELLWGERVVRSVANLTRRDGEEFLALAPQIPIRTEVETFPLDQANEALDRLRAGRIRGAAVLAVADA